jgi:gamma-glutamyl AIG2-like cyclotransferase
MYYPGEKRKTVPHPEELIPLAVMYYPGEKRVRMPPFLPQELSRRSYFAFGSNMVATQMHQRCPAAQDRGMTRLDGWRFLINQQGYATIMPDQSAYVLGVLWSLTSSCEAALDDYEEIATSLYTKAYIEIQDTPALVYLATNTLPGHPRAGYLEAIIAEAYRRCFDLDYITKDLKRWL